MCKKAKIIKDTFDGKTIIISIPATNISEIEKAYLHLAYPYYNFYKWKNTDWSRYKIEKVYL